MDLLSFWGKTDPDGGWHPAVCHMLDVGRVGEALVGTVLPTSVVDALSRPFDGVPGQARPWLALLCALHDLGKVSPGFQKKRRDVFAPLDGGFAFSNADESNHGAVTAEALAGLLGDWGLDFEAAEDIARALGGHHGSFPSLMSKSIGKGAWEQARREVVSALAETFGVNQEGSPERSEGVAPAWLMALAGLASVSDWIGSDERFFPYAGGAGLDVASYAADARTRAERAIREIGWSRVRSGGGRQSFGELFFDITSDGARKGWTPNAMQSACCELAQATDGPFLLLVEAPTGSGKTEAALWVSEILAGKRGDHGLYYALPTQATSNQMLERLLAFLHGRFPGDMVPLHLLHGMASMNETFKELRADGSVHDAGAPAPSNVEQNEGAVVAREWFCGRKRGLLSPFAVGTVDQALLAALTTRHFFVRLFGLAQKTVVIDEVHAYDTYMSTLLDRLLEWLSAMGTSVILLSATLPARRRQKLVRAYTGRDPGGAEPPYPRAIIGSAQGIDGRHVPFEKADGRALNVTSCPDDPAAVADLVADRLTGGGCAAWICNTVSGAQEAYRTLREDGRFAHADLTLFHARYPVEGRLERERAVLQKFAKEGERPEKAVVVATQVIEQSLDLDFDFMVTDLAPVDLILQRAGRLHRHPNRPRPPGLEEPEICWLAAEADEGGIPAFGVNGLIYDPYIVLRTWLLLRDRDGMNLPADTENLIETVYGKADVFGESAVSVRETMEECSQENERKRNADAAKARRFIAPRPSRSDWFDGIDLSPPDDDKTAQRLTRLGRPTVTIICAHETDQGLSLQPDGGEPLELEMRPDRAQTARLLERSVRLSLRYWYNHFVNEQPPPSWREVPLLRSCRLAVFRNGELTADGRRLILDDELGLYDAPENP